MKRNTDAKDKPEKVQKAWRFYRSNLPTLIWGNDDTGVIADFSEGHFTTKDKKLANALRKKGYVEIDLKSTAPPNIVISPPVHVLKEGQNVPVGKLAFPEAVTEVIAAPEVIE